MHVYGHCLRRGFSLFQTPNGRLASKRQSASHTENLGNELGSFSFYTNTLTSLERVKHVIGKTMSFKRHSFLFLYIFTVTKFIY